jgi:hypothetical protein
LHRLVRPHHLIHAILDKYANELLDWELLYWVRIAKIALAGPLVRISCWHPKANAERTIVRNPVLFDGHLVLLEMITGIDGIVILEVVGNDGQVVNFWVTTLFSSSLKFDGSTFCESSVLSSEQSRNSTV